MMVFLFQNKPQTATMRLRSPITVPTISEVEKLLPPHEDFEEPVTGLELGLVDEEVRLGLLRVLRPTGVVESDSPKILEFPYRPQIGHVKNEYQNILVVVAALPEPVTAAARVSTLVPAVEYPFSTQ